MSALLPGTRNSGRYREIASVLARVSRPTFQIAFSGLGSFGSHRPHALWVGLRQSPELKELQGEHERLMQRIGLDAERRKFTPHVTLARLRSSSEADVAAYLALRGNFSTPAFPVGRFVLLSSRDSRGGGPYVMEEAYPLAA